MATGDISAATVLADGWEIELTFEGFTTGATFNFGFTGNNVPSDSTPYLTVVSEGYDATGTLGTITRTVYLTKNVRKVYPNEATANQTGTSPMTARFSLSDYVYLDDNTGAGKSGTAPTITIPAAFCTNTGGASQTSNALAAAAVTNNSTLTYPKVTANWSWPGYHRVTGDFTLRCVAFEPHGQSGCPVRCVKFTAADTHSHTVTTTVIAPTYDSTIGDAVPVVEYVATMSVSTLDALDVLTCNFIAYPWVGDENSLLDTSTGTAAPTHLYGPIKLLNDKSNTYGVTCALVDPTGSDAGAKTVYDASTFDPSTAYKFLTIDGAAKAIAAYNNTNRSRNTLGGGMIYLNDGTYQWTGGSSTIGTTPSDWVTVTRATTSTNRASVIIGSAGGSKALSGRTKLMDLTITSSTSIHHQADAALWFDQCTINFTGAAFIYSDGCFTWWTRNTIPAMAPGFTYSSKTTTPALIRGNTLTNFNEGLLVTTFIGNLRDGTTRTTDLPSTTAGIAWTSNKILAFNRFQKINRNDFLVVANVTVTALAVVQNVFEFIGTSNGYAIGISSDTSTTGDCSGVVLWNNVLVGCRWNVFYNDTSTNAPLRTNCSVKNNLVDDHNTKHDTFGTPNAARVNGWSQLHGVNWSGNFLGDYTASAIGAIGLTNDFAGLSTLTAATPAVTYLAYTSRAAWAGGAATSGNGTYSLTSTSPVVALQRDNVMPYDIAGTARASTDAAGAYHYGSFSAFKTGGLNW